MHEFWYDYVKRKYTSNYGLDRQLPKRKSKKEIG